MWSRNRPHPSEGDDLEFLFKFDFKASNNEAKYEVLIFGLRIAWDAGVLHLTAYSDSPLVVRRVKEHMKLRKPP
ncbi:UNVERIFIED_CONTAM: hypothetical protein Sangu_1706400 [Sesamum angustifolium]|uniref:RNase H type-1 domain-containing protein n=1 Tax=Sesamum angustifolium TaxID=2727405 RepID=A0AAW2MJ73_9LAMI